MESNRQKKIAQLLQNDLGDIFREISKTAKENILITVTKVRVTPDLSHAKVYLSIFPLDDKKGVLNDIQVLKPQIRKALSDRISQQLRKTPDLNFFIDDSLDYIETIEQELNGEGDNPEL
ncbi:MAG: 30S ribosome-binding factor RbfA [Flavobacteriales bacterium]